MTEAGWYNDDQDPNLARWHDGKRWTEYTLAKADWPGPGMPPPPGQPQQAFTSAPTSTPPPAQVVVNQQKKRGCLWWVGLGVVAIVVIGIIAAIAGGGDDDSDQERTNTGVSGEVDDVTLTSCESEFGIVTIGVEVVNNSSKTSNYLITLTIEDSSGTRVGDGSASTNNLAAGATARIEGFGTASDAAVEPLRCKVADVERYAS